MSGRSEPAAPRSAPPSASSEPTVGVSCGHRVPRVATRGDRGQNLYWCEACGAHRMSGGRCSGEFAFDFLLELRDEITSRELVVNFDHPLDSHQLALVEALGARVRFVTHNDEGGG